MFGIANAVGISNERIYHIFSKKLIMGKLSLRLMVRLFTNDQKQIRYTHDYLERLKKFFLFLATNETFVHYTCVCS